jgi:hypothetical protein
VSNIFSYPGRSDQPVPMNNLKSSLPVPISFFDDVRDNGGKGFLADVNHMVAWRELCDTLKRFAEIPFKNKADAPLFSPTVFSGTRCEENATVSALVVIDADKGFDIRSAERLLIKRRSKLSCTRRPATPTGAAFGLSCRC